VTLKLELRNKTNTRYNRVLLETYDGWLLRRAT